MNRIKKEVSVKSLIMDGTDADLFVCAVGYESRSIFYARQFIANKNISKVGLVFTERQLDHFSENFNWCKENSFHLVNYNDEQFLLDWQEILKVFIEKHLRKEELVLVIDISSMTRRMMAHLIHGIRYLESKVTIHTKFVYSPSKYSPPDSEDIPVTKSEPVIPEFAGWTIRPDLPATAIVGLGYECGQALGTLEFLEPAEAWVFVPEGNDSRFDVDVKSTNEELFEAIEINHVFKYKLNNPFDTFCKIESLVFGLKHNYRPILIPFGPKIFALISMLAALIHGPNVTVWRVSGEQEGTPSNREPDGTVIGLEASFIPVAENVPVSFS